MRGAVLFLASCSSPLEIHLTSGDSFSSTIVAVDRGPASALDVTAFEGDGSSFSIVVVESASFGIVALRYSVPLAELGLEPGVVEEADPGEGTPLPEGVALEENVVRDGLETGWHSISTLPDRVASFRMKAGDPTACADRGGCTVFGVCQAPCPPRSMIERADPPDPPEPPAPVDQRPCPEGWREEAIEGAFLCRPPYVETCAAGAQLLPDDACASVGTPCDPSSSYAIDLPVGPTIVYVAPLGSGDGTSPASPLPTMAAALAASGPDDVIALSKGVFREVNDIELRVVIGACTEETIIASTSSDAPALHAVGDVSIMNLRVRGPVVTSSGTTTLSGVVIEAGRFGWLVETGALGVADRLHVRDHLEGGILGRSGARIEASSVRVEEIADIGIDIRDDGTFGRFTDAIVRRIDEAQDADDLRGRGFRVGEGSELEVERAIVDDAQTYGLTVAGGRATVTNALVRKIRPRLTLVSGLGMDVQGGGLVGSKLIFEDNRTIGGVFVRLAGTATLADVFIQRTSARASDGEDGEGLVAREGSNLFAERVLISESVDRGIWIEDPGTRVRLADIRVRDVAIEVLQEEAGFGIEIEKQAIASVQRALIERTHTYGVFVFDGAHLDATDLVIRDVDVAPADRMRAHGLRIGMGSTVNVARMRTERTLGAGVSIILCTGVNALSDLVVSETFEAPGDPEASKFGGIWIDSGTLELNRVRVEASEHHGVRIVGGAVATVRDLAVDGSGIAGIRIADQAAAEMARVEVVDTRGDNIIVDDLSTAVITDAVVRGSKSTGGGVGSGVDVTDSASLTMRRFILGDNDAFGAQVAVDGQLDLADGEVFGSQIGVLLITAGYDLGRVTDRVAYRDNQTAISRGQ